MCCVFTDLDESIPKHLVIFDLYRLILSKNSFLYAFDGNTNTTNVSIDGINEIKYPIRNNHASSVDFIQPEKNDIIKRGIARIIKTIGAINKCLCCWICSYKIVRYFSFI
jgi:hypothetical protein